MVFNQLYYRCSKEEQSPRLFSSSTARCSAGSTTDTERRQQKSSVIAN
ncbi:hypothetical protein PRIPAC_80130 [Pristionchus pacificus]|uniref:Uncharacterized protein n=1 Tax=Pristionchus pacificus TaxID=54126 RepID=A0A2A6CPU7_PRIPA|nr:hypothetical protein PRIPAC_80130 [Pristionchus pacificus]|eukprot:PDM80073.1 hypothetical protein PRIPAC_32652 [Pristionchus pacificus]